MRVDEKPVWPTGNWTDSSVFSDERRIKESWSRSQSLLPLPDLSRKIEGDSARRVTGRRPADMLDIYKYISSDLCEAYNLTGLENFEGPFFRFSWDRQKLFVDPTPVEKFVSQLGTWPAATRVFLPTTKGDREERPWERGWVNKINKIPCLSKVSAIRTTKRNPT